MLLNTVLFLPNKSSTNYCPNALLKLCLIIYHIHTYNQSSKTRDILIQWPVRVTIFLHFEEIRAGGGHERAMAVICKP